MKILAIVAVVLVLTAGCAPQNNLTLFGCKIDRPSKNCSVSGSPANPDLNFNKNGLVINPNNVCTEKGAEVTIKITPANQSPLGTIIVFAKIPISNPWLIGSNNDPANPDTIKIKIPDSVPDGDYDYLIFDTVTGNCLDPRWEVQ